MIAIRELDRVLKNRIINSIYEPILMLENAIGCLDGRHGGAINKIYYPCIDRWCEKEDKLKGY